MRYDELQPGDLLVWHYRTPYEDWWLYVNSEPSPYGKDRVMLRGFNLKRKEYDTVLFGLKTSHTPCDVYRMGELISVGRTA